MDLFRSRENNYVINSSNVSHRYSLYNDDEQGKPLVD